MGLNCIAVTEHNNLEGAQVVKAIAPFLVIQGEEIKSTEGEITGLFLEEEIPPGLTPLETVRRIKDQGALVSIPHPFTGQGRSSLNQTTAQDILPHVDIIEGFNARTMRRRDNARGQAFAKAHGLAATAVSDAHTTRELGRAYTELPEFDGTPQGFKEALAEARLVGPSLQSPGPPLLHGQ